MRPSIIHVLFFLLLASLFKINYTRPTALMFDKEIFK